MKTTVKLISLVAILCFFVEVRAQEKIVENSNTTANTQTQSLAKKLNSYVFPANSQSKEEQEKDEFDCYKWAVEQTGVDPISPPKVEAEQVETGPDGGAVVGATAGGIGGLAGSKGRQQQKQQPLKKRS